MDLGRAKAGETIRIIEVKGRGPLRRRLLDMGLTPGTVVRILKFAPFGDPVVIRLRGYELSIRKNDAALISVERIF